MNSSPAAVRRAIAVCALGYFIDIFDIQLFPVLRVPSLHELGVSAKDLTQVAGNIINVQMFGMILGAFLWGWLGDRFGRLKALYGSILLYSLGTIACGFVGDPGTYGVARFVTGFGLAGETGVAITLIAEMMPPETRGWGIVTISAFGFLGPVFAVLTSMFLPWRETYLAAGALGFLLLVLRLKLIEPAMFEKISRNKSAAHPFRLLLQKRQAGVLVACVVVGLPMVFCWNILNFFSLEFSQAMLGDGEVFNQKTCLMLFYVGTSCGDAVSGAISQRWRSRRKAMASFLIAGALLTQAYLLLGPQLHMSVQTLYGVYFLIGLAGGAWILFCMMAAEHFGTNVRATTSSTVVNLVRGSNILLVFTLQGFRQFASLTTAAALLGAIAFMLGLTALYFLKETHGADLDYIETKAGS
ncbi:MAG: MFS transporter [Pseudomonadota bacterium]|nr:MFS transporter [Pseudomonadota bacterium]